MSTTQNDRENSRPGLYGTVVDVIDAGTFWLLQASFGRAVAETPVEPRYMADIVAGEGVSSPRDLIGRRIWASKDGLSIAFIHDD
jgi:hypothetical protein